MKTRLIVVLFGLFSLLGSTTVMAHDPGYGGIYGGAPLTGGVTIWSDSYGNTGYAANVSLGFAGGYVNYGYAPAPYYGHVHGSACGHMPPYGYARGYDRGYRHGHHGKGHHGKGHHGRRHR